MKSIRKWFVLLLLMFIITNKDNDDFEPDFPIGNEGIDTFCVERWN